MTDDLRTQHRREFAEELARRFELLATGKFSIATITLEEAASLAREIVCPTCHTEDGDPDGMACIRSWHRAVEPIYQRISAYVGKIVPAPEYVCPDCTCCQVAQCARRECGSCPCVEG